MRLAAIGVLLAGAVACTSAEVPPLPEPVEVETCDQIVDVSVQLVEVWVGLVEQLPVDQLLADTPPPEFAELAEIGRELDARAARLGCDPRELNAAVVARLAEGDAVDPEGPVAEMVLELVRGGVVAELPQTPMTTTTVVSP